MMSLRDNWTRYVTVGNIFSGLVAKIVEKGPDKPVRPLMTVRRPAPQPIAEETLSPSKRKTKERKWEDAPYLKQRQGQYRKALATLNPVEAEEHTFGVQGKAYRKVFEEDMYAPITLSELELYLQQNNNEAWALIEHARTAERHRIEDEQHAAEAAEAARAAAVVVGPRLTLSAQHLSMPHCAVGHTATAAVTVRNVGTTALFFRWAREARDLPPGARRGGERWFYLSDQVGCLLPDEQREFSFSFRSSVPGVFHDRWRLATSPELSAAHAPAALTLTAVSLVRAPR